MIVSVTGARATHVCAMGYADRHDDELFVAEQNVWKNPFSNETMLCRMSDGSMMRINEFRRIGHPGTVGMSLYGTEGSYEEQAGGEVSDAGAYRSQIRTGGGRLARGAGFRGAALTRLSQKL